MKDGLLSVEMNDLPFGEYALILPDDENENGTLDKFLGLPKGGFFSAGMKSGYLKLPGYSNLPYQFLKSPKLPASG
jgi:uncharacterized protein (DUF2141 family)